MASKWVPGHLRVSWARRSCYDRRAPSSLRDAGTAPFCSEDKSENARSAASHEGFSSARKNIIIAGAGVEMRHLAPSCPSKSRDAEFPRIRGSEASECGARTSVLGSAPAAQTLALGRGGSLACGRRWTPRVVIARQDDGLAVCCRGLFPRRDGVVRTLHVRVCARVLGGASEGTRGTRGLIGKRTLSPLSLVLTSRDREG